MNRGLPGAGWRGGLVLLLFLGWMAGGVGPSAAQVVKLTFVDTLGGADLQWFFTNIAVPEAKKDLGFEIDYVVSSGPEIIQRLKAQQPGRGDLHVVAFKVKEMADAVQAKIPLEKLYPEKADRIPNIQKNPKDLLMEGAGVKLDGHGALVIRVAYNTIYNSEKIARPPKSWKELFDRREEFKGRIATIRTDAKSSGGRAFVYAFLNGMGVDFSKPWPQIQESKEWKEGLAKLEEFSKYLVKPVASEAPILFEQFKREDAWITSYSTGYTLWSRDKGLLPKSLRAASFEEGDPPGTDGYLVVPANIPEQLKPAAYRLVDHLISDKTQVKLITSNWIYSGTDIWEKVPKEVWSHIPPWSEVEKRRLIIQSKEALDYIQKQGMRHFK